MKIVTVRQLEADFESIIDDVADNKQIYRIQTENGNLMLVPYEDYEVLKDTYQEWVEEPQNDPVEGFDPYPLPFQYVADAEPEKL
jgi:PHD/YefM family antitoxin component YafN of YafNO toxin-antitoxin module